MTDKKEGCVKPAAGPLPPATADGSQTTTPTRKVPAMLARVGHEAPDFEATAYMPATRDFQSVKLSDYKGKWITLCFYPGDFTFV